MCTGGGAVCGMVLATILYLTAFWVGASIDYEDVVGAESGNPLIAFFFLFVFGGVAGGSIGSLVPKDQVENMISAAKSKITTN